MDQRIIENLLAKAPGEQVIQALRELLDRDGYLLKCNANERSISHRFAMHLQSRFPDWDIDCEYNRDGVDPKRIGYLDLAPDAEDAEGQTVFPDIIAHERGTQNNYLVIEIKKSTSGIDRDIDRRKLEGYKRDLSYQYALFIEFEVDDSSGVYEAEWIDL